MEEKFRQLWMDESLPHHARRQWRRLLKYLVRIPQNHAAKFCFKNLIQISNNHVENIKKKQMGMKI